MVNQQYEGAGRRCSPTGNRACKITRCTPSAIWFCSVYFFPGGYLYPRLRCIKSAWIRVLGGPCKVWNWLYPACITVGVVLRVIRGELSVYLLSRYVQGTNNTRRTHTLKAERQKTKGPRQNKYQVCKTRFWGIQHPIRTGG